MEPKASGISSKVIVQGLILAVVTAVVIVLVQRVILGDASVPIAGGVAGAVTAVFFVMKSRKKV